MHTAHPRFNSTIFIENTCVSSTVSHFKLDMRVIFSIFKHKTRKVRRVQAPFQGNSACMAWRLSLLTPSHMSPGLLPSACDS